MEQGRRAPDPKAKLEACYCAIIEAAQKHAKLKGNRIVIGGKSMGGRIASQVAAAMQTPPASVSYFNCRTGVPRLPIASARQSGKIRDAHLAQIVSPMLFIQGSRDAFGTRDEILDLIKRLKLRATLHAVEGGDHSLKAPKSSGLTQEQVYESAMDKIVSWLNSEVVSNPCLLQGLAYKAANKASQASSSSSYNLIQRLGLEIPLLPIL